MSSAAEIAQSVIASIGSPERKQKNETSHGANPPSMIAKIEERVLPIVLEALFTIFPDYDENNHLTIGSWDVGLAWVVLKELSQPQAIQLQSELKTQLGTIGARQETIDAVTNGLIQYRDL